MREAADAAFAARSIAQMVCRAVIASRTSRSAAKLADQGKIWVNRKRFLADAAQ
jgi:hypothetical protein